MRDGPNGRADRTSFIFSVIARRVAAVYPGKDGGADTETEWDQPEGVKNLLGEKPRSEGADDRGGEA